MDKELKLHWLLLGELFGSFGNSFIWPLTTIYMHNQLHQSLTISGIVLMLYSCANVIGSSTAGALFDRYDPQKLMISGLISSIIIMTILVMFNGWPAYPILLTLFGFFIGWIITLLNSFGTQLKKQSSRFVFNMLYFTNNLGVVLGTMIAGPFYQMAGNQVAPLFVITIVMYLAYTIVVIRHFRIKPTHLQSKKVKSGTTSYQLPMANRIIIFTLFGSIALIWLTYAQWSSNLSVYMTDNGITMSLYSFLWTINGFLIVVFQLIINWLTKQIKNDFWFVYFGVSACCLSFVVLIFAHTYLLFVLGMIILTLGEATAFPSIPAIIADLSPQKLKGKYQGFFNAATSLGKAGGPLIGGIIIELFSYHILFIVCSTVIGLVELTIIIISKLTYNIKRF
ncbi:MFS transporter [Limosilactobacillus urinaemulieris]|uniref:MFS transporter n=1 Tax=Limosilactobacillus urinaemulieris TaxID=2742600 RepID=UPI001F569E1D|nr:MFS transporter [Limosilactobacillus urinaemulieris]